MKRPLIALFATSLIATALGDVVVEQKIDTDTLKNGTMIMKIKGPKARVDMPDLSFLINTQSGDMATLEHKRKMVMMLNMNTIQKATEAHQKAEGIDPAKVETKATGVFEQVGPWKAEVYEFKHADRTGKLWVVRDFPDAETIKAEIKKISGANTHGYDYCKVDVPGMIVKSKASTAAGGETVVTLVKASQTPVADTEFTVPKGYSALKMPTGPR